MHRSFVFCVATMVAVIACGRQSSAISARPKITAVRRDVPVWPMPKEAVAIGDGISIIVLRNSSSSITPGSYKTGVLLCGFRGYRRDGSVMDETASELVSLDHVDSRWRRLYSHMRVGQIVRVWFENPDRSSDIYDVELISLDARK